MASNKCAGEGHGRWSKSMGPAIRVGDLHTMTVYWAQLDLALVAMAI